MRGMTSGRRFPGYLAYLLSCAGLVAALALGAVSCSDKGGSDKFVGSWTYSGAINPNCMGANAAPVDLTGETVVITATDSSHIRVALGTMCTVSFEVDGTTATAAGGQKCTFDIPSIGPAEASITTWTLMVSGDTIASNVASTVLICTPSGAGTLTRQSTDASASQ
jgi:hypothetical protein